MGFASDMPSLTLDDLKATAEKMGPPPPPIPRIVETRYAPYRNFVLVLRDAVHCGSLEWVDLLVRREIACAVLARRWPPSPAPQKPPGGTP